MNDCAPLANHNWHKKMSSPHVLCYDQECIDLKLFPHNTKYWSYNNKFYKSQQPYPWFKSHARIPYQFYNKIILVHSEKNSASVELLANDGYIPVHWFSHAVIAMDWFRFAEHDPILDSYTTTVKNRFLIYNRAWSGSREYRISFAEQLVKNQLIDYCQTSFGFYDNEKYYQQHQFKNPAWIIDTKLEDYFSPNLHTSNSSADYDSKDYVDCAVEVVLETVFDDTKIHITEKSLRPIAVGKPFILVASAGALQYLRNYGFETFSPWINESYDLISDPVLRMQAVVDEMRRLSQLDQTSFDEVVSNCNKIAQKNRQRFFNVDFFNCVVNEYRDGVNQAVELCIADVSRDNWDQWAADQSEVPNVSDIMQNLRLL